LGVLISPPGFLKAIISRKQLLRFIFSFFNHSNVVI
jgi:hypothetical protein